MNWVEAVRRCCSQCPAGMFLSSPCSSRGNDTNCTSCSAGTFLTQPNTLTECQACYECDHQTFQTVLTNCTATSNVVCGCEPGRFRQCHNSACTEFSCQQCDPCAGRLILRPCSEAQDTVCGGCKPNFYSEGTECRPCHTSIPETCGKECQRVCGVSGGQGAGLAVVMVRGTLHRMADGDAPALPCRLRAGIHPAGAHWAPLSGCPRYLPQEEASPAQNPSRQPPHPDIQPCGHTTVPGQCPGVGQPVLDPATLPTIAAA
uniref:Uncharacterized protein n=1 Tax=Melopsittacus undulatus TaxID=13146 RepID=A0A8C6K0U5_MELUD